MKQKTTIFKTIALAAAMMLGGGSSMWADDVTYDFTNTSVWGTQTIANGTELSYTAAGASGVGVTFYFAEGGAEWDSGKLKFNSQVSTSTPINYVKISIPAGYAADVTAKSANNSSRRVCADFSLTTKPSGANQFSSDGATLTFTNSGVAAVDLYIYQYGSAGNSTLSSIRIYEPAVEHTYTYILTDGNSNTLKTISGSQQEGREYTVSLPKALMDNSGNIYILKDSEGQKDFSVTRTMSTSDYEGEYVYELDATAVYYNEVGGTAKATASNGSYSNALSASKTLGAGQYSVELFIHSRYGDDRDVTIDIDDVRFVKYLNEYDVIKNTNINLSSEGTVKFGHDASQSNWVDYIIIRRTGDAVTTQSVTIGSIGWATLYTSYPLDFSAVDGLTAAYTASLDETTVTLNPVNNVPANTGVVLEGTAKSYNIPVLNSSSTAKGDLLGSSSATAWNAESGYTYYVLASVNGGANVQFNPVTSGSIAAGKAFLKVESASGEVRSLNVVFADETTGISAMLNDRGKIVNDKAFYNLQGQRVAQPKKGLYLVNGKKIVINN